MAAAQNESNGQHDLNELRIVLLGVSGAGKSPTANAILGREVFRESRTRESEIQRGRVEDRNISIIDTPGFFNTQLTDEEQRKQMMKSLDLSHPGPHVFLVVINLESFRDDQRNIMEQIRQNFGEEALHFTMVLFVGREKFSRRVLKQIIESEETQRILNYFGGRFHVINSKTECETSHITMLIRSIDDMVKNNGGQNYKNEMNNIRKLKEQERIKQEEARPKIEKDRMKQEQVKKRQEESDGWKQKGGINQEEQIKTKTKEDDEQKQDDVKKKRAQCPRQKDTALQEDLRKQLESRRQTERQRWANDRATSRQDLRIVILGKTDVGKTATTNTILGIKARALAGTLICEKQEAVVSGRTISIIDTPGLFDAPWYKHLKGEVKCDIEECLNMSAPGPHVFLLVVKLNGRHTEDEKNTAKWIQENFGEDALCHTIVLFTHADFLIGESLDRYMRKSPDLQSLIDSCGGRFHSFSNQDRDNQSQVTKLLEKIGKLVKDNREGYHPNEKSRKAQKKQEKIGQEHSEEDILHRKRDGLLTLMMALEMSEMALRLSLARAVAQSCLSRPGPRIVLLGFLGAGKSSTGNTILGRNAFRSGLLTSTRTSEKQSAVLAGRRISIVDTPGILDPLIFRNTEDHNMSEVEKSLEMCAPGPHVFLLVIGLEGLVNENEKNSVKWFQENLEKDALNHTVVLVAFSDILTVLIEEPLNEYIKKNRYIKSLIDSCGGRYHLLDNNERDNKGQVTKLLEKIDETVQRNGGRHYTKQNIFKKKDGCEIQ